MIQPGGSPDSFGAYLHTNIAAAGYPSASAFARACGFDPSVALRWIAGAVTPTAEHLIRAAPHLGVPALELIARAYGLPLDVPDPHPIAAEITRMLGATSPLPADEQQLLVELLDRVLERSRGIMRRERG